MIIQKLENIFNEIFLYGFLAFKIKYVIMEIILHRIIIIISYINIQTINSKYSYVYVFSVNYQLWTSIVYKC